MKFPSLMQLLTMFGDPDVHHLWAEDPTRRGMSLICESSQFFYYIIGNSALQSLT